MSQAANWRADHNQENEPGHIVPEELENRENPMNTHESTSGEPAVEDKESKERESFRTYEYRDAEGRLIGRATIETGQLASLEVASGNEDVSIDARELKSFIWEGEKDGETIQVDVLKIIQHDGDDAFVIEDDKDAKYSAVYPGAEEGSMTVVAPRPDNPASMAVFLHEFGHADQRFDEEASPLMNVYSHKAKLREKSAEELNERLDVLTEMMPEFRNEIAEAKEVAERIGNLEKRMGDLQAEALGLKAKIEGNPNAPTALADAERLNYLNDQIKGIEKAKNYILEEADPYDVASLPTKFLETDASMRAVEWMRQIQEQSGSDLFAKIDASTAPSLIKKASGDCAESAVTAREDGKVETTSAREFIAETLKTYDAKKILPDDLYREYFTDEEEKAA